MDFGAFDICNMATLSLRHPRDRSIFCPLIKKARVTRHERMKSSGFLESVNSLSLGPEVSSSRTRHDRGHFLIYQGCSPLGNSMLFSRRHTHGLLIVNCLEQSHIALVEIGGSQQHTARL